MLLAFKLLIFLGSACVFLFHTLSNITTALFFVKEFSIFFLTLSSGYSLQLQRLRFILAFKTIKFSRF